MKQRIGAMFSRVPGSVPALGAGAAIGGFVLDAWRQEEQDRARMVNRVLHNSFHAFQPKVEIPREQVQARCHAQVVSIRVALSFTPVVLGHHEAPAGSGWPLPRADLGQPPGPVRALPSSRLSNRQAFARASSTCSSTATSTWQEKSFARSWVPSRLRQRRPWSRPQKSWAACPSSSWRSPARSATWQLYAVALASPRHGATTPNWRKSSCWRAAPPWPWALMRTPGKFGSRSNRWARKSASRRRRVCWERSFEFLFGSPWPGPDVPQAPRWSRRRRAQVGTPPPLRRQRGQVGGRCIVLSFQPCLCKGSVCCEALPAPQDLAQALRTKTFEEVRLETISAQDGVDLSLFVLRLFVLRSQEREILLFFGIDAHGGLDGVKAAKEVARRVADAPFEQCVRSVDFADRFASKHLAQAVKAQGAHCIYVKATTKADERFCAASPSVHALLKQKTDALEANTKPKRRGMFWWKKVAWKGFHRIPASQLRRAPYCFRNPILRTENEVEQATAQRALEFWAEKVQISALVSVLIIRCSSQFWHNVETAYFGYPL